MLLATLPGLPEHGEEANKLRKALRRLRRAAGEVRDLDVQRKMLEELESGKEADPSTHPDSTLAKEAEILRDSLGKARKRAADRLQKLVRESQVKTASRAEKLLKMLEENEGTTLTAEALSASVEALFQDEKPQVADRKRADGDELPQLAEEQLHHLRKRAKAARYLAETMPASATLGATARRFEALQEAGGQWHDALALARTAKHLLGRKHELTQWIQGRRDRYLQEYREALQAAFREGKAPGETSPARRPSRDTAPVAAD